MKSRCFMIILYSEDISHISALNYAIDTFDDFAYILHDKDVNSDGTLKKPHIHLVIRFSNPRSISSLAKELHIQENYISVTHKNYKYALKYLIHYDNKEKFQYSIEEVQGTLKKELISILSSDKQEDFFVIQIIHELDDRPYRVSTHDFVLIICNLGLWSYFRRASVIFLEILKEHNSMY